MSRSSFRRFLGLNTNLSDLNRQLRKARGLYAYVVSARAIRVAARIGRLLRK